MRTFKKLNKRDEFIRGNLSHVLENYKFRYSVSTNDSKSDYLIFLKNYFSYSTNIEKITFKRIKNATVKDCSYKVKKNKVTVNPTYGKVNNITHTEKLKFCPKNEGLFIPVKIQDSYKNYEAEIDSGSGRSLINPKILKDVGEISKFKFKKVQGQFLSISGHNLNIRYQVRLRITIKKFKTFYVWFLISEAVENILLGRDFLFNNKCILTFENSCFTLQFKEAKNHKVKFLEKEIILPAKRISKVQINVTNIPKGAYSIKNIKVSNGVESIEGIYKIKPEDQKIEILFYNENGLEKRLDSDQIYLLLIPEKMWNKEIKPDTIFDFGTSGKSYINNIFFYKCFFNRKNNNILLYNELKDTIKYNPDKACKICLDNISFNMLHTIDLEQYHLSHIPQNKLVKQTLNEIENIKMIKNIEPEVSTFFENGLAELHVETPLPRKQLLEIIDRKLQHIPEELRPGLRNTLVNSDNISRSGQYNSNFIKNAELDLEFKSPLPKLTKIYNINPELKPALFHTLQTLVHHGLLERAGHTEAYGSPLFVKRKKDSNKLRLLVDLREYNSCISASPQAGMSDCSCQVRQISQNARWVTQIDLSQAYFSIPYSKRTFDSGFANILTCFGTFKARFCIQGTNMAPTFLDSYLNTELEKNLNGDVHPIDNLLRHFDDIHIYNNLHESEADHIEKIITLLNRLAHLGLHINIEKCQFSIDLFKDSLDILGYTVSHNKLSIPKNKYFKIKSSLVKPQKVKDLQSIIGILSYFRQLYSAKQLDNLAKLSNKIKDKKLAWDHEGDCILSEFSKDFESESIVLDFPNNQSLCVLFTDASEVSGGGILKYAPLDAISFADAAVPRRISLDEFQINHATKHRIKYINISEELNLIDILTYTYKLYNYQNFENNELDLKKVPTVYNKDEISSITAKIIDSGYIDCFNKLHFEGKDHKEQYKNFVRFIIELQNEKYDHYFTEHYFLRSLAHILNRTFLLLIKNMTHQAFIKIASMDAYISPVVIYYNPANNKYQLMALLENFGQYQKFSTLSLDKIDAATTFRIYNKLQKDNPKAIKVGPVYRKKWSASELNLSIPVKELFALYYSLYNFGDIIKLQNILVASDSLCLVQSLKTVSNRERKRFNLHSLLITSKFPSLKICHVSGKKNPADYLTRLSDLYLLEEHVEKEPKFKIKNITIDNLCKKTAGVFEKHTSFQNIALQTLHNHAELYNNKKYTIKNNVLFQDNKIFIPDNLIDTIILKVHMENGHVGLDKAYKILIDSYFFLKNKKMVYERTRDVLSVCVACMSRKPNNKRYKIGSHADNTYKMGDVLAIDYLELEKSSSTTNFRTNAILVCTEMVSGATMLYFHTKISSEECVRSLMSYLISHNRPNFIWSDNASVFTSTTFKKFLNFYKIKRLNSSPQKSSSKGFIEVRIKILRFLSRLIRPTDELDDFPLLCVTAANLINNLPRDKNSSIDFTPLNIYKFGAFKNLDKDLKYDKFLNHLDLNMEQMTAFGEKMNKELDKRKKRILADLKKKNKNRIFHKFKIGSFALVKQFSNNKLKDKFLTNPYRIIKVNRYIITLIDPVTQLQLQRHVKDLKIIKLKDISIPDDILSEVPLYTAEYIETLRNTPLPSNPSKRHLRPRKNAENKKEDDDSSETDDDNYDVIFDQFL